jgi:GntR family uxuAB operon transcriptional repressor
MSRASGKDTGRTIPAPRRPGKSVGPFGAPVKGSARIAAELRRAILEGAYALGDRLPAERELAVAFDAARTTVREGLRILETDKLVSRRVGSGTFVVYDADKADEDIAEITSPLELIEVRIAFEPQMGRLAVVNATARDIDRLARVLAGVEAAGSDLERFTLADQEFHLQIAEATHNPLMISFYRQINHVRGHDQWNAMKDKVLTADIIANYNREHRAIFAAIESRDSERTVRLMTDHLSDARRDLMAV